jgi:general secretion pathway protein J
MQNFFRNNGFTLIEMLIALTLSSFLLLAVYAASQNFIKGSIQGSIISNYYENIYVAIRRIDADILNAYWNDESKNVYFVSKLEGGFSKLSFVTVEKKSFRMINNIKEDSPSSDIHEVGYYIKKNDTGQYDLIRRSLLHYNKSSIDENEGEEEILLKNVKSLKFSFRSGNDWTDKWDTREGVKLPPGIKTTLVVTDLNDNDDIYEFFTRCNML